MGKYAINEELLQQIETLEMIIKNNVAGLFGGNHTTKSFGSSCEFRDYRDYAPGDDIHKIDWNAYARFDHLYLKQYLDERRLHTRIYIDASRSMDFNKTSKANKALEIAALFAYLSLAQMDKVSIYYVQHDMVHEVILNMVGKDIFYQSINKLNDIPFDGDFAFSKAIMPTTVGYGDGLSLIISDFLTDENYTDGIDYLLDKKRDVLCIQVLSEEELNPTIRGKIHYFDSENTDKFYRKNINKDVMQAYREALQYVQDRIKDFCNSRGASYLMIPEKKPLLDVFLERFPEMGVLK